MKREVLNDLSKTLINDAEHDCAEYDPEMCDAAGMVLVGDVYALRVAPDKPLPAEKETPTELDDDDTIEPFIR